MKCENLLDIVTHPTNCDFGQHFTNIPVHTCMTNQSFLLHLAFDHNVILFEPAPSLKFDAVKTVSINIRVSSQRARDNLSNCLAGFDWTPLYLQPSCEENLNFSKIQCLV